MPASKPSRLSHIDALKAVAAQCIVLHHLAAYGPVAEAVQELAPGLIAWLYDHARMAVQVFLVVGGYLSARGLLPDGQALCADAAPAGLLWKRYQRLGLPFMGAVVLTLACYWLVAPWLPELLPQQPVAADQLLAHALLLHGVLGYESLTVGAWYVAIDLQLFALLLALAWFARRAPAPLRPLVVPLLTLLLVAGSLFVFNRDAALDNWAPYFFGAYGLGVLLHLLERHPLARRWRLPLAGLLVLLVLAALAADWRARVALALGTVAVLAAWGLSARPPLQFGERLAQLLDKLGTQSYALFLVHFSVLLLVNALFEHKDPEHPWFGPLAMLAAWALSNLAAALFYRWVEQPASRVQVALPALLRRI